MQILKKFVLNYVAQWDSSYTLVDEDDDDEDVENEDVYMYQTDMHPDERDAYRSAVRASKASEWEREQYENIVGSKRKTGESSQRRTRKSKVSSLQEYDYGAQQAGMGIEPPSPFDIKNKYLEMGVQRNGSLYNGSAFMKAGKQLMKKYNLYWTPCAAHCIDLIFEDIAQMRLYVVETLFDQELQVVPTMPFVYELMHVMKTNLTRQGAGDWMFKIIQDRWEKTLKHPLHAAGVELVVIQNYFKRSMMFLAKLDPTTESLGQLEMSLCFFEMQKEDSVIERQLQQGQPWCSLNGVYVWESNTYIEKVSHQILSQTASSLPVREIGAQNDRVAEKDYLDLLDISAEVGEEEDNQLFQWVRPIHLDDEVENPDPRIAAHAREFGVNVERVLSEEVHSESFSKDTDDSHQEMTPQVLAIVVDLVRRYFCFWLRWFKSGTDDGDEDHGSRRAGPGIGAIGKPYRGRERMMEPYNEELLSGSFESMSKELNLVTLRMRLCLPPHVMSYGQPSSSTDEEYGMSRYSPSRQMSYQVPYQMEGGLGINTWVNFEYPIHVEAVGRTQEIYAWHVRIFNPILSRLIELVPICLQQQDGVPSSINPIEPHRSSFWY
ncbi:hypothetical protein CK203_041643 [Vitis vinifera]|uniref:DUF659 domain-containing protein n=1 Tax=Vitis vinifera TaxID=29760 RepID=A0A438I7M3_VITVI|nr:hypothetical protein CK203_041643 [Vitis vinifera]